jgi:hypothetical protein
MAGKLTYRKITAGAAVAATIVSSAFFSARTARADQCTYSVLAKKAPAEDKIEPGAAGKAKSVTIFVPTGNKNETLAVTVPGDFLDSVPNGALKEALYANAVAAIDTHLAGNTPFRWDCEKPIEAGLGSEKPAGAPAAEPLPKPGWTVPGNATAEKKAPSVAPSAVVVKPDDIAKGTPVFRFGDKADDIIRMSLILALPDGASKKVVLDVSRPWIAKKGMSGAKTAIVTKLDGWLKSDGIKISFVPVYEQLDKQMRAVQDQHPVKQLPSVK